MKYNLKKHYKETSESRRSHHRHLVRPDGTPISAQDCCIFDLLKQWTKNGKVATSTYEWLLKEKFPHKKDKKTVRRAFWNLSLYFKCKFEQKQVIDDKVHFHKLRIERVADFDIKTTVAEQKEIVRKCPQLEPKMVTAMTKNSHTSSPSTPEVTRDLEPPIKNTIKSTINDNHDYQHNQFSTYKNFNSENIETKETKIIENSEINIAKQEFVYTENEIENYEYAETPDYADVPIEVLEENIEYEPNPKEKGIAFVEKAESLNKTQTITSYYQNTEETVGKDGNTYQSPYLQDFRFTEHMINTAISRSNKKHYTSNKVWLIIRNILERKPDKLVYGGRQGVINYLVKAINGENDYKYKAQHPQTQEEKAQSMAEIQAEKQKAIDERYQMLLRGKVQSLSGAERYYG